MNHSWIGRRWLNVFDAAVESRYSDRIVVPTGTLAYVRELQQRLAQNRLISIYCDPVQGSRNLSVPFLDGQLAFATNAATLAIESGAPLLPVFPICDGPNSFRIIIEAPLDFPGASRRRAIEAAIERHASRLEWYVLRYPDQWSDWLRISFTGSNRAGEPAAALWRSRPS